jgi:L-asparaginase
MDSEILLVTTGGTIDSDFDPISGTVVPSQISSIPDYIHSLQLYETVNHTPICMKDSRDLTDSDRKNILNAILDSEIQRVIVTHGSYTVVKTAQFIKENIAQIDKVIIFVCSLIPVKGFSVAGFNLGYALAKSQDLQSGVYICMNGRVFDPNEVVKILEIGQFKSTYTK